MIEAIQSLLRLQEVDLQLHAAREELATFPPAREAAAARRTDEQAAVAHAAEVVEGEERRHRALESELREIETVLERLNGQLYEVTSKHAMETLQSELDRHGEEKSDKEDLILELLETIDQATEALEHAREAARTGEETGASDEADRAKRERELEAEIAGLAVLRKEREVGIDTAVMRAYEGARRKRLPAVVFADAKRCPVCQMGISPQKWIELSVAASLVHCEPAIGSCTATRLHGDRKSVV